jgi:hypothetical protein
MGFINFLNAYQVFQWGIICEHYYNGEKAQSLQLAEVHEYVRRYEECVMGEKREELN